jgi:hypothetical protein
MFRRHAEWPRVANAVIEAHTQVTKPILASRGRYALDARVVRHVAPTMD